MTWKFATIKVKFITTSLTVEKSIPIIYLMAIKDW